MAGALITGVAGAGPSPVTVNVRTVDQGESIDLVAPPTVWLALTRQKHVPFGRPLTLSRVTVGRSGVRMLLNPETTIVVNADVFDTCHV